MKPSSVGMAARPARESSPSSATAHLGGEGRLWLLVALLLGAARFLFLGRWSLWYDEVVTLADAFTGLASGDLHNPLGYRAIRAVLALRGGLPDELGLRLLPALVGWLCIPLTYWCFLPLEEQGGGPDRGGAQGRRGRAAGLAALLVAVSTWALYWSQNARFYTLAQAVSLIGSGLLLRGLFGGSALRAGSGMVIAGAAASLHLSAALVFGALAVSPLLLLPLRGGFDPRTRRVVLGIVLVLLLALLIGHRWAWQAWRTYLVSKSIPPGLAAKLASLAHFVASLGFFVTPLLATALLVGAGGALRRQEIRELLPLTVVVVGILAAACAALFGRVTAQYAFAFLPWIAWVAARPAVVARTRAGAIAWAALLVLPAAVDQGLFLTLRHGERPRWREAVELVWSRREAQDLVLMMAAPIGEHYLAPDATDLRRPTIVGWIDKWRPDLARRWYERSRNVWIVLQPENLEDWGRHDREALQAFLESECHLIRRFPVPALGRDLSVEVYYLPG